MSTHRANVSIYWKFQKSKWPQDFTEQRLDPCQLKAPDFAQQDKLPVRLNTPWNISVDNSQTVSHLLACRFRLRGKRTKYVDRLEPKSFLTDGEAMGVPSLVHVPQRHIWRRDGKWAQRWRSFRSIWHSSTVREMTISTIQSPQLWTCLKTLGHTGNGS